MYGFISLSWVEMTLRSDEIMLRYIQETTTRQGLGIEAVLHQKKYEKGIGISDEQMTEVNLSNYKILPQWNFTIIPNS
ncbi:hypothetical protein GWO43_20105 [candidate division KSB1 bacterium]|nr:hypothetical protein [candidate division KSB1 bacterium]NIR71668.1 hypothetical protein [candidate division KSB1 bacterium]NIS26380.1 hypothetical protein [candidate division KSB1 bacterium]NIT73139.1 hypothetical protein [candidate division KSB1 bacterium]NIU27066.1 hypothetical protein [candidate division KSB1 bacterium]